jgi:pyruvate,water dikinase
VEASERHLHDAGVADAVERLYAAAESDGDWRRQAVAIRAALAAMPLDADVAEAVSEAVGRLTAPLAVRSSAAVEDSRRASFAGLFTTVLGATNSDEVANGLRAVWASRFSSTVIRYALGRGVDPRRTRMAVIVQEAIDARCAGGALSRDPGGGITVTAARGLCASIVFERAARLALAAERVFGTPQEVEWALDHDDRLWLLQSRPLRTGHNVGHSGLRWSRGGRTLEGLPVSPGRAVGRARHLRKLAQLEPGDVVIAATMPPGTVALLPRIAAMVLENAGSTAHAATLARERGIPAVFGVVGARRLISDGARIEVDGSAGRVHYAM